MKKLFFSVICCFAFTFIFSQNKPVVNANHIAFYVVKLAEAKKFYHNIIGLDTITEPFHDGKHCWLTTGNGVAIHLIEGATVKKDYYKNNHTCFSVASIQSFMQKLKENNIGWEDVAGTKNAVTTRPDGVHQIWLQDPDGYWIEINDAKF
ncbi:MAG: glyoxalase [Chitinophaga sp.]|nr:glyoxalase [Chitinophaga sp.]